MLYHFRKCQVHIKCMDNFKFLETLYSPCLYFLDVTSLSFSSNSVKVDKETQCHIPARKHKKHFGIDFFSLCKPRKGRLKYSLPGYINYPQISEMGTWSFLNEYLTWLHRLLTGKVNICVFFKGHNCKGFWHVWNYKLIRISREI